MDELRELLTIRQALQHQIKELSEALIRTERECFLFWAPIGSKWKKVSKPAIKGKVTSHEDTFIRIKHNQSSWPAKVSLDGLLTNWVPWRE